jgi:hypothetical protein
MKTSMTTKFIITGVLLLAVDYSLAGKAKTYNFTSKEEIMFQHKDEQGPLNMMKSKDYVGNIARRDVQGKDGELIDVYEFPDVKTKKMDEATCLKLLDRTFGKSTENALERSFTEISNTPRSGAVCEVAMLDKDSKAKIPERRFYARLINEKTFVFVFKKRAGSTENTFSEDAKSFVIDLR